MKKWRNALNLNSVTTNTVIWFITLCSLTFSPGNILSPSYEKLLLFFLWNLIKIHHKKAEGISFLKDSLWLLVSFRCLGLFLLGFQFIKAPRCLRARGLNPSLFQGTEAISPSIALSSKTCPLFWLQLLICLAEKPICHLIVWSPSSFHLSS